MVIFYYAGCLCIVSLSSTEEALMDTEYFLKAMAEWEQKTGKKCIMSNVDASTFSALLRRAQQLKEAAQCQQISSE